MSAANCSGLQIVADRLRQTEFEIGIGEADCDDVTLAANDNVRVKIGRTGDTPILDIQSAAPTAGGSSCTVANPTVLTLSAADMIFPAGIYDIEVAIVDVSQGSAIKKAERGILVVRDSMGGAVT